MSLPAISNNNDGIPRCKKGTGPRRPQSPIAAGVDICNLPMKPGPCTENTPAWYYDPKDGTCAAFSYGGCEGNANRYESEEQCLRQCGSFKNQDVCSFERDWGPCVGRFRKFHYNAQLKACEEFTFGGCGGNGNRFSSLEECQKICLIREEPEISADESSISKDAICKLKIDTGLDSCTDNLRRWHYDSKLGSCTAFIYSGCAGNRNRFKNFDTCMGFCEGPPSPGAGASSFTPPPRRPGAQIPPVDDLFGQDDDDGHPPYEEPDEAVDCSASEDRCNRARCKYGTDRYYDDRTRCEECYCSEPCHGFECPMGTTCQVGRSSKRSVLLLCCKFCRWSHTRLEATQCTKQFVKTTPSRGFVLK